MNPVAVAILVRLAGWALVLIVVFLALVFSGPDEPGPCVHCQRPARSRDRLGRPVCYLHGQVHE